MQIGEDEVKLEFKDKGLSAFYILDSGERVAEMAVSVSGGSLTAYHTEVSPKMKGKGLAKKLLGSMEEYVRSKGLKVIPLCPFVHAQFKQHPDKFGDLWNDNETEE